MEGLAAIVLAASFEPPPEFAQPPESAVIVYHVPSGQVDAECQRRGAEAHPNGILGCASTAGPVCIIVMPYPDRVDPHEYVRLMRHELAHCNGWSHD